MLLRVTPCSEDSGVRRFMRLGSMPGIWLINEGLIPFRVLLGEFRRSRWSFPKADISASTLATHHEAE
jgi:hypothetical protein